MSRAKIVKGIGSFVPREFYRKVIRLVSGHVVLARQIGQRNAIAQGVPKHRVAQMTDTELRRFIPQGETGVSPREVVKKEFGGTIKITPELAKARQNLISEFDRIAPKDFKRGRFQELRKSKEQLDIIRKETETEAGFRNLEELEGARDVAQARVDKRAGVIRAEDRFLRVEETLPDEVIADKTADIIPLFPEK